MDIICECEKLGDFIVNVIDELENQIHRRKSHETGTIHNGEIVVTGIRG